MLLLTATTETQGEMPGDFCGAIEGELVVVFADCEVPAHHGANGLHCTEGCPSRFYGLNSHQRSTTAMVRQVRISREDYLLAMEGYAQARGSDAPRSWGCALAEIMVSYSITLASGTVTGFREGKLAVRRQPRFTWATARGMLSASVLAFTWRRYYGRTIESLAARDTT